MYFRKSILGNSMLFGGIILIIALIRIFVEDGSGNSQDNFRRLLINKLDSIAGGDLFIHKNEEAIDTFNLLAFYRENLYTAVWEDKDHIFNQAIELINSLKFADSDGLDPADYHFMNLQKLVSGDFKKLTMNDLVSLELMLTDAYLVYANSLYSGKVCPQTTDPDWHAECKEKVLNYKLYLNEALVNDRIFMSLEQLKPHNQDYKSLKKELAKYYRMLYDPAQEGMPPDSIKARINTIRVNLERWRWLPLDLGEKYVEVNIANFDLNVIEKGEVKFNTQVIVGKNYRATPVLTTTITGLVINPYWIIPPTILKEDILPLGNAIPDYLKKRGIKVLNRNDAEISPDSIEWSKVKYETFKYRLRQEPGPGNPLGTLRFTMDNPFMVYLHDTPTKDLFEKSERTFSSGCIRVRDPYGLALILLSDNTKWNKKKLAEIREKEANYFISIKQPVKAHVLYWTAWADKQGVIKFKKDIYGRDSVLIKALNKPLTTISISQ